MDPSNDERLNELEAKVHQQSAQIDVLTRALSDLLAAHAVLHKDVRLFAFLQESRDSDRKKEKQGGTERTPASFFANRGDATARLLEEAANSQVFDQYWFRSLFWRSEEKARGRLDRIRRHVQHKASEE